MHKIQKDPLGSHLIALTPVGTHPFSEDDLSTLDAVATRLQQEETQFSPIPISSSVSSSLSSLSSLVVDELPDLPLANDSQRLLFDDFSVISHIHHVLGLEFYTSRAFVRAGEGDVVLGTFEPLVGYADYLADSLGFGRSHYHYVPSVEGFFSYAICEALLANEQNLAQLVALLSKQSGTLWIHPYMGHEPAWRLGAILNEHLDREVRLVAPPPRLCQLANDKVWFAHAVAETLGEAFIAPVVAAKNATEAVRELFTFAKDGGRVSIKLADSASGMGTTIFEAEQLLSMSKDALTEMIEAWILEKNWIEGSSPDLAIEPWFDNVLGSPSVQLWIPPLSGGVPIVEGIYDQLFYPNDPFVFLGSMPSQLPAHIVEDLRISGAKIGRVFQQLGYVGRCSFDSILVGDDLQNIQDVQIKYVECNGRWGGTSTPMTLLNRLFGDYRERAYVASDFDDEKLKGMSVEAFVQVFQDILFDQKTGKGWGIIYNVGCLKPSGKLDLITLGKSFEEAQERQMMFRKLVEERL